MYSLIAYASCVLVLLIGCFIRNKKVFCFYSIVILTLFNGLRVGIGNDYAQYLNIYNQINAGLYSAIEPTYILLSKLLFDAQYGFNYLLAIYTFLTYLILYRVIYEYKIGCLSSILLFSTGFVFYANNQVRQALATALFIYSIRYIISRDFLKYVGFIFFGAVFFHFSSIILIAAYFIKKTYFNRFFIIFILCLSFVIMKLNLVGSIIVNIISILPYYSDLYLKRFSSAFVPQEGSGIGIIFWMLIAAYIVLYQRKTSSPVLVNLFIVGTIINIIFINYDIFERISFYFIYIRFILIALIMKSMTMKNGVLCVLSCSILISSIVFSGCEVLYDLNKHGVTPYVNLMIGGEE